jgi:hypothetical protein
MRFIVNNKGQYYHIIEELKCPFNEKADYIILKDDEIIYWQNANLEYYHDVKLNIEDMKLNIDEIEKTTFRSELRKQKTLNYLRETLNKMISYERELKIDKVLKDDNEYKYWLC